jgi:hypothetical protein
MTFIEKEDISYKLKLVFAWQKAQFDVEDGTQTNFKKGCVLWIQM